MRLFLGLAHKLDLALFGVEFACVFRRPRTMQGLRPLGFSWDFQKVQYRLPSFLSRVYGTGSASIQ